MTENPNSRIVTIKRAGSFLSRSQGKEIDDFYNDAIQEVGSYFESSNSKRIASGLTIDEEKFLMPFLLGVDAKDREFFEKRNNYFMTMSTKVPYKDGLSLETGLTDSSKPLSPDNMPLNISDYVRYRQIIKHPWVGKSEAEAKGNQLLKFYLYDAVKETAGTDTLNEDKDLALAHYLKIKDVPEKVDMMLTLLSIDPRDIVGQTPEHTEKLRKQNLRTLVDKFPTKVVLLSKDKNFENKFTIQSMVNSGVLKVIGTRYIISETDQPIGNYEETVDFFRDEKNSQTLQLLKAKNQEAQKVDKKIKRTVSAS